MAKISIEVARKMALALTTQALEARGQALLSKDRALFEETYHHLHSEQAKTLMSQLIANEGGAFPTADHITVNAQGRRWDIGDSRIGGACSIGTGSDRWLHLHWYHPSKDRLEFPMLYEVDRAFSAIGGDLGDRLVEFSDELTKFTGEVASMLQRAYASVRAFSTYRTLQERWPDAMPVIGSLFPEPPSIGLPAVTIAKLNAEFGLPPE